MNPEYFDIKNLKMFGMWPHQSSISRGIAPYIKRMSKDKVSVLIFGDHKGEQAVDLVDLCGDKLEKVCVVSNTDDDLIKALFVTNTKGYNQITVDMVWFEQFDVVCVLENSCDEETLERCYKNLPGNGIFCGNGHEADKVKVALTAFRRNQKIGTPIQVSNRAIWFWNKRA